MSSDDEESRRGKRGKFMVERESEVGEDSPGEPPPPPDEPDSDMFGPCLPPHLLEMKKKTATTSDSAECENEQKIYGPVLPGNLRSKETKEEGAGDKIIGPAIPEHLKAQFLGRSNDEDENEEVDDEEKESEECFGPSPALMTSEMPSSSHYKAFERKTKREASEDTREKRESWMLELPENKTGNFTLGTRRFKTHIPSEKEADRSVWTETPQDKQKKKKEKDYSELLKSKMLEERNQEMEALVEAASSASSSKRRKKESLMEMHTKKLKKKKKKEAEKQKDKKPERRPFDRNVDLQIRRIDENQRRSILNKAMYLNSRFAAGESKFL